MLVSLSKNRPKDLSKEDWQKMWDNLGYSLAPLYTTCQELIAATMHISSKDFDVPNHYAKMAFEAGRRSAFEEIVKMLPNSAKTP